MADYPYTLHSILSESHELHSDGNLGRDNLGKAFGLMDWGTRKKCHGA